MNTVKRVAAKAVIVTGSVGAIVAVVAVASQLEHLAGRRWI
jgi:hypothetical protein